MTKIKNNIFLILGVALPVLIVTFVWILRIAHQRNIPPPQYNFIYVENNYSYNRIVLENNAVYVITAKVPAPTANNPQPLPKQQPKLYLYDLQSQSANELSYHAPMPNPDNEQKTFIFNIKNASLSTDYKSPDNFIFESRYRGGSAGIIFGGHTGFSHEYYLKNDGKKFPINIKKENPSNYVQFLAWIVPNGSQ
ncbi:hypothetical protein CC99x_006310 [Candidatus Berkiella cookevillensis]|uniref:Uncharacterized protein n=1 Tax=Candidatus Berkiella cookevillensis TaxID=437022 RepID=A0A0Q9YH64_9GAMM|nr:hypothetical protein [Candidatus Berkiella cookevillensis]MCS5708519.1 hypothetical protein [Candidatus Berkiella cookevillensis]